MQLNLRKARKLEAKIQNHVATVTAELELKSEVRVKGGLESARTDIATSLKKLNDQIGLVANLLHIRFRIRRGIEQANETVGINNLLNRRAQLIESGRLLGNVTGVEVTPPDAELSDLLESKALALTSPDNHYASTTVEVGLVTEDQRQEFIGRRKAIIKQLEDVEDELSQKNLGASVTLTAEDVTVLKSEGLV